MGNAARLPYRLSRAGIDGLGTHHDGQLAVQDVAELVDVLMDMGYGHFEARASDVVDDGESAARLCGTGHDAKPVVLKNDLRRHWSAPVTASECARTGSRPLRRSRCGAR